MASPKRKVKIVGKRNREKYRWGLRKSKIPFKSKKVGKSTYEFTIGGK